MVGGKEAPETEKTEPAEEGEVPLPPDRRDRSPTDLDRAKETMEPRPHREDDGP